MPESAEEQAAREVSFAVEPVSVSAQKQEIATAANQKEKSTLSEAQFEASREEEGVAVLKQIVREEIIGEVEKMKTSLQQALKETEDRLSERLAKAGVGEKGGKSPQKKK